jgi:vitamin B12 transporter
LLTGIDFRYNNTDQFFRYQTPPFPPFTTVPTVYETSVHGKSMNQVSPYASLIFKNDEGFTAELGGRWNRHSKYGSNFSFTINPALLVGKVKVFANLYSAYKVPTLYQLFDPFGGNENLKPEKGMIVEAGVQFIPAKEFQARLVGFYRNTKDAILYINNDPPLFGMQYRNVGRQKNYGIELEANYTAGKWTISSNYAFTDGKTTAGYDGTGRPLGKDTTYYNLYRIPKHALNFIVGCHAAKNLFISTSLRMVSKREEFIYGGMPETQKGYATIDLYGDYHFSKKLQVFADLKNLTNKQYFDIPGYNSKRFNFMVGARFNL